MKLGLNLLSLYESIDFTHIGQEEFVKLTRSGHVGEFEYFMIRK